MLQRVKAMGLEVEVTDKAKDILANQGWDANYGARPLKRAIQKNVEDVLAEEILMQSFPEGTKVLLDYDDVKEEMFVKKTDE